ncbi:MAG: iron uptake porin [Hormoscilla sp.]
MKKCLLPIASAILGSSLTISDMSLAQTYGSLGSPFTSVEELSTEVNAADSQGRSQTTSVSQLSDIEPTDWAYQALQSLIERYGCVAGYPDGSYRGNRALTRYEFAAGLNACLDRINELIASATSNVLAREDINRLLRLQDEYAPELATLRGRIDALEALTAELEANQFSTTAKLFGFASFTFTESWGKDPEENPIFESSATLNFDTSFTGRDLLRAGLTGSDGGVIEWGSVYYRFPLGFRGQFYLVATGQSATSVVPSLNPVARSPIYGLSSGGGVGINYQLNDWLEIGATYFGSDDSISDPSEGKGLFNGQFGALAQVTLTPNNRLGIGLTYARYYAPDSPEVGSGGSSFAEAPFGEDTATSANAYGLAANYRFSDSLIAGAWVGYTEAKAESSPGSKGIFEDSRGAEAELWYWGLGLAFPDVGKLGSQLSFLFRMEPKVTENDLDERIDPDTGFTILGSYSYPLTDRIRWTSNLSVQINPESDSDNDSIWEGSMRFSFSF